MRHRALIGSGLVLVALIAGVAAAKLLEGHVPLESVALGCLGASVVLLIGDVTVRRFSGQRGFWARYLGNQASWSVRGVLPLWLLGLTLLVAALSFPAP